MQAKYLHVLLKALICLQQVNGRVLERNDTSISKVADESPTRSCPGSEVRAGLHARQEADDDCQEALDELAESDDPIEEGDLKKLEAGDFSGLDCAAALVSMYVKYKIHTPALGTKLARRDDTTEDPTADCKRAQDLVQKQKIPDPCKKIKDIEFDFTLANSFLAIGGEGNYDDIGATLEGLAGKVELKLTHQPSAGDSKWVPVNMQESFKSDSININGINNLTLTAETFFFSTKGAISDQFKVQDTRLRAKCADPGFGATNDRHVGINARYERPQKGWWIFSSLYTSNFDKQTVATFPVVPADWAFAPPCNTIKDLSYEFTLSGGFLGISLAEGNGDTLTLKLGEGKIALGNSFDAQSTSKGTVDLQETFNKATVDMRDLKTAAIDDDSSSASFYDKGWKFQGVTFSATCADVRKRCK